MTPKQKKISQHVSAQTSTQTPKRFPTSHTTEQDSGARIPTKDKSPDDLEILD